MKRKAELEKNKKEKASSKTAAKKDLFFNIHSLPVFSILSFLSKNIIYKIEFQTLIDISVLIITYRA
jgi:hypothetical protein